jgi:hypothetical protein
MRRKQHYTFICHPKSITTQSLGMEDPSVEIEAVVWMSKRIAEELSHSVELNNLLCFAPR